MSEEPSNRRCFGTATPEIHGMIDANAYHAGLTTWPVSIVYVRIGGTGQISFIDSETTKNLLTSIEDKNITDLTTADIGDILVKLNSYTYNRDNSLDIIKKYKELTQIMEEINNLLNGRERDKLKNKEERKQLNDLDEKEKNIRIEIDNACRNDVPSLIVAITMDMEFAHIDGYNGESILRNNKHDFQKWKNQIKDTEAIIESNPLRYFSLFSYDPRRYRYSGKRRDAINGCDSWEAPFEHIVGYGNPTNRINKFWLGFCLNPALGFRPYDEFCEYLPKFYKECNDKKIPILAHCAAGGITVGDVKSYKDFDIANEDERKTKSKKRNGETALSSSMYRGKEHVVADDTDFPDFNDFYMHYGHPRNWIPVLKYFPGLRLCLSGFGGNSEWQHESMTEWAKNNDDYELPKREWIRCIIKLTIDNNVYADISGLNIYDNRVRLALLKMLRLIQNLKNDGDVKNASDDTNNKFKHLKYKLIFGSGWYFSHLTDMSTASYNYRDYCREFKSFFNGVDPTGELWERVSLINPWKFYGFDNGKIDEIYNVLQKNASGNMNCELLEKMNDIFNNSIIRGETGLVKYIASRTENDPNIETSKALDETDDDLIADTFAIRLVAFTKRWNGKYVRTEEKQPTDTAVRQLKKDPVKGTTRFDCSGWVGYCINTVYRNTFGEGLKENYPTFYNKVVLGTTGAMIEYIENKFDETYRKRSQNNDGKILKPLVGDLAFWRGHVEIVIEVDGEKFRTSGSAGNNPDPVPCQKPMERMKKWFFDDSWDPDLKKWGNGTFLGFWTIDFSVLKNN